MLRPVELDHLVLTVADVERSLAWYRDVLGCPTERVEEWRRGEAPFPSVRLSETSIVDLLARAPTGTNVDHFCVVIEPVDLDDLAGSGRFEVVAGPMDVFGARGMGRSVYVRDPDGNTVELRVYPPR